MQVSHLITRGILLVIGRVTERVYGVLGVIGGSRGDQRWSKGVCEASVLHPRSSNLSPQFSILIPQSLLFSLILNPQPSILGPQSSVLTSWSSILSDDSLITIDL